MRNKINDINIAYFLKRITIGTVFENFLLATLEQTIYHMRLTLDSAALKRRITNSLMKGKDY